MIYYIEYYTKKYWIVIVIVMLTVLMIVMYNINNKSIVDNWEPYNNRVTFTPNSYEEVDVENIDELLSNLKVGEIYIPSDESYTYIPPDVIDKGDIREYASRIQEDPYYMYKLGISWADGNLSHEEFDKIMNLIGYHLNNMNNGSTYIVQIPTLEQLHQFGETMVYNQVEEELTVNLWVDEYTEATNKKRSYLYSFVLEYNMRGYVEIQ